MKSVGKLIEIGGAELIGRPPVGDVAAVPSELQGLISSKNGFYAFESALHVFPVGGKPGVLDLRTWNSQGLWRLEYGDLAQGCVFFAEDIFGGQFCIKDASIFTFDPETGDICPFADDIEEWAQRILSDYEVVTGYPLAHQWQNVHGPIAAGSRLLPKKLFVTGGAYSLENLYAIDAVEGMRFRGSIARQIHALPDRSKIEIKVVD